MENKKYIYDLSTTYIGNGNTVFTDSMIMELDKDTEYSVDIEIRSDIYAHNYVETSDFNIKDDKSFVTSTTAGETGANTYITLDSSGNMYELCVRQSIPSGSMCTIIVGIYEKQMESK